MFNIELAAFRADCDFASIFDRGNLPNLNRKISDHIAKKNGLDAAEASRPAQESALSCFGLQLRAEKIDFSSAQRELAQAERDASRAIDAARDAAIEFRQDFAGQTVAQLQSAANASQRNLNAAERKLDNILTSLQERGLLKDGLDAVGDIAALTTALPRSLAGMRWIWRVSTSLPISRLGSTPMPRPV